ncbi:hypothetical protein GQX74_002004 [Glossina fuscipes]|nr:hypothetical protein GQX74_002004 [Glossina fuscipes]
MKGKEQKNERNTNPNWVSLAREGLKHQRRYTKGTFAHIRSVGQVSATAFSSLVAYRMKENTRTTSYKYQHKATLFKEFLWTKKALQSLRVINEKRNSKVSIDTSSSAMMAYDGGRAKSVQKSLAVFHGPLRIYKISFPILIDLLLKHNHGLVVYRNEETTFSCVCACAR